MEQPFALHITWTTYGTWLPGDSRGYVGHTLEAPGDWQERENSPGTAYAADHERTRDIARSLQKDTTVRLNFKQAETVAMTLIESAVKEVIAVGKAVGVGFKDGDFEALMKTVEGNPAGMTSSMAHDRMAGKPLEVNYLSGAVVRIGEKHGIQAPTHKFITQALAIDVAGKKPL